MIKKEARGGSKLKDPVQKDIVSKKDDINERTSRLIDFIKELKKGWNGNPAPGVGVDAKYKLIEPMPDQLLNSGQMVLQELAKILEALKEINQEQDNYAAERQQRMEQRMQQQPVQASFSDEFLIKEASNPLSRLWSHIKAPFSFVEKNRWERLRLLRALAKIFKDLETLNDKVLEGDKSILEAVYQARQLYSESKSAFFEDFEKNLKQSIENIENESSLLKELEPKKTEDPKSKGESKEPPPKTFDDKVVPGTPTPEPPSLKSEKPSKRPKRQKVEFKLAPTVTTEPTLPTTEEIEHVLKTPESATTPTVNIPPEPEPPPTEPPASEPEAPPQQPDKPESEGEPEISSTVVTEDTATPPVTIDKPEEPPPESVPLPLVTKKEQPKKTQEVTLSTQEQNQLYKAFLSKAIKELLGYVHESSVTIDKHSTSEESKKLMAAWLSVIKDISKELKSAKAISYQLKVFSIFVENCGKIMAFAKQTALSPEKTPSDMDKEEFSQDVKNVIDKYVPPAIEMHEKLKSRTKTAAAPLTRGVRRFITNILPGRDKNIRLRIDAEIKKAQDSLQKMMDILEQRDLNYRMLISYSEDFYNSFTEIFDKLADLADNYNAQLKIEKSKGKKVPSTISQLDISYLRRIKNILQGYKDNIGTLKDLEGKLAEKYNEIAKAKAAK